MNARGIAASASLVLVVLAPVLVGSATTAPKTADPAESALTLDATNSGLYARIVSDTKTPDGTSSTLVDTSGVHVANAEAVSPDDAHCLKAREHNTGSATSAATAKWCIHITGIKRGTAFQGKLIGTGITLTVNGREPFLALPILVVLLALALAVLLLGTAGVLQQLASQVLVEDMLEENEHRDASTRIAGLRAWVTQYRAQTATSESDTAPLLKTILTTVPARAAVVRAVVAKALAGMPQDWALRALLEADAQKPIDINDYYDATGNPSDPPACPHVSLATPLEEAWADVQALRARVEQLPQDRRAQPLTAIGAAELAIRAASSSNDLGGVTAAVSAASDATHDASIPKLALGEFAAQAEVAEGKQYQLPAAGTGPPSAATRNRVVAWVVWLLYVGALVGIAVAAIYVSNYITNPSFGSRHDYLGLAIASLGSGAAATVFAAIGFWRVAPGTSSK